MPKEIERKFTVGTIPEDVCLSEPKLISQGYLSINPEIRIRSVDNKEYFIYIKKATDDPMVREEHEIPISESQFKDFKRNIIGKMIHKVRYTFLVDDDFKAEVDEFLYDSAGFRTIEVEFPNLALAKAFIPPSWFGTEVTDKPRYRNVYYATGVLCG